MIRFGGPIVAGGEPAAGRSESHGSTTDDIDMLVQQHIERGFRAACVPAVSLSDHARIVEIREKFAAADIILSEVQCWNNLLDPDPDVRRDNRESVVEALALAEELGAVCALDTVGSYAAESLNHHHPSNFSSEAFDAAVETARYFIDAVRPTRTCFAYEVLAMHIIDEPPVIEQLVKAVNRRQFAVHLDLVNLVNCPRKYWATGDLARECVRRFGAHIIAAHAKDVILEDDCDTVRLRETRPGLGNIDYRSYLTCLDELAHPVTLMMEHLETDGEYMKAAAYIRSQGSSLRSGL